MTDPISPPPPGPPPWWQRQDFGVVAVAAALFLIGAVVYRTLVEPGSVAFDRAGLAMTRPAGFLPPVEVELPATAFAGLASGGGAPGGSDDVHEVYQLAGSPLARVEVRVGRRPPYRNVVMGRQLERQTRYGELYWSAGAGERTVQGQTWHRAEFRYAIKPTADDAPRVATGVEYATVNDDRLYVVTFHGDPAEARWLEGIIAPTLRVK